MGRWIFSDARFFGRPTQVSVSIAAGAFAP
jgi:hypothetical protein